MYTTRMFRSIGRFTPLASFSLMSNQRENDVDLLGQPPPDAPKTGWERVKQMYSKNQYEEISLEITNVLQSTMTATFIGVCIGGFVSSKSAYLDFVQNNQATIFKSTADAKKKLQDYITISFAKGAVRWGWRLGIFTGIFSLAATTIAVYRGNTSVLDYITAGAIAGGLYKLQLGPVATLVGAGLGATLGGIFGTMIVAILKVTGFSMDDIRKALNKLNEHRVDQFNQALDKQSMIKNDALAQHHEQMIMNKPQNSLSDVQ